MIPPSVSLDRTNGAPAAAGVSTLSSRDRPTETPPLS